MTCLTHTQPPILVSRLMLNLRQINTTEDATANSDAQHLSRLSIFANINIPLGNIGEPLTYGKEDPVMVNGITDPPNPSIPVSDCLPKPSDEYTEPIAGPSEARRDCRVGNGCDCTSSSSVDRHVSHNEIQKVYCFLIALPPDSKCSSNVRVSDSQE